jgi:hypothetical protein
VTTSHYINTTTQTLSARIDAYDGRISAKNLLEIDFVFLATEFSRAIKEDNQYDPWQSGGMSN